MKIDGLRLQPVGASKLDCGARNLEIDLRELRDGVADIETAAKIEDGVLEIEIFGFALAGAAERIQLALEARLGEASVIDSELADDGHGFDATPIASTLMRRG